MSTADTRQQSQAPPRHTGIRIGKAGAIAAIVMLTSILLAPSATVVWLIFSVLITVHEAGHFAAARRVGFPVSEVSIGIGPTLLSAHISGVPMTLRAVPIVGWVAADLDEEHTDGANRRQAWVAAAGPAASLIAAFVLIVTAGAVQFGPSTFHPTELAQNAAWTAETAYATPTAFIAPITGWVHHPSLELLPPVVEHNATAVETTTTAQTPPPDSGLVTVVAMSGAITDDVHNGGVPMALAWAAAISAAMGGLNLLPAYGLDGYTILEAVTGGIRRRSPRLGGVLRLALTLVGLALLSHFVIQIALALLRDISNL